MVNACDCAGADAGDNDSERGGDGSACCHLHCETEVPWLRDYSAFTAAISCAPLCPRATGQRLPQAPHSSTPQPCRRPKGSPRLSTQVIVIDPLTPRSAGSANAEIGLARCTVGLDCRSSSASAGPEVAPAPAFLSPHTGLEYPALPLNAVL